MQVIALLGGFTVTILSFILPSYLHLQIVGYNCIGKRGVGSGACSGSGRIGGVSGGGGTKASNSGSGAYNLIPDSEESGIAFARSTNDGNGDNSVIVDGNSSVVRTDIALTIGGVVLCTVATAVTTIGFMSRVGSNGGQCT